MGPKRAQAHRRKVCQTRVLKFPIRISPYGLKSPRFSEPGRSLALPPVRSRDADTDPMTTGFLQKIFGSRNQRLVKQYQKTVSAINALEPTVEKYSDDQLRAKTDEFRQRVAGGESLDVILPEAFAVCREASRRVLKMRHFDVQLIGGMVLHTARSPKCAPARARRSSPRSQRISMR